MRKSNVMECETSAMVREMMRRSLSRYAQIVIDGFTLTRMAKFTIQNY